MATPAPSVLPPLPQLDIKQQAAMKHLISTVILSFYDANYYILVDILLKNNILRDDDLAGRVGLNVKELTRVMGKLTSNRLVQAYRQNEMKENQGRIVGKQYYWIDLQKFCNVVKWRITNMRVQIEDSLKADLDNKGYVCPRCTKSFTTLDADQLFDPMLNIFACDICGTEVIDNENSEKVQGSKDRMQRFNVQIRHIREALREIEGIVVPAFDVARYVREQMAAQRAMNNADEDGLKVATGGAKAAEVEIHIIEDDDEDQKKREKQKTADEKRRQNVMPSWHTNSTISGDKTALGIQAEQRSNNEALLAELDAQAKLAQPKSSNFDTFNTEEYYERLINEGGDSPRGTKRKLDEGDGSDPRQIKLPRRDGAGPWGTGTYPPIPGRPYGYPPQVFPSGPGPVTPSHLMPGYRPPSAYPPMPGYYTPGSLQPPLRSQSSAGTSRNTPSQGSDSDSSQEMDGISSTNLTPVPPTERPKKGALNGTEKRVSFAEQVHERSASPMPPPSQGSSVAQEEYNPWVKIAGKDVRARDIKEGDEELMTPEEYEAYWNIKEKLDEMDAAG